MTTDRRTRTTPPTAQQLVAVITGLPVPDRHTPTRALHLATPVNCVVGVDSGHIGEVWWYRDSSARVGVSLLDVCDAVAWLARDQHRPGDEYLDLGGDPVWWCKPLPSGRRVVAYGSDLVLGLPSIVACEGAPPEMVHAVVRVLRDHPALERPAIVDTPLGTVLLCGGTDWVRMVSA